MSKKVEIENLPQEVEEDKNDPLLQIFPVQTVITQVFGVKKPGVNGLEKLKPLQLEVNNLDEPSFLEALKVFLEAQKKLERGEPIQ